jgi:hypothetical protein
MPRQRRASGGASMIVIVKAMKAHGKQALKRWYATCAIRTSPGTRLNLEVSIPWAIRA